MSFKLDSLLERRKEGRRKEGRMGGQEEKQREREREVEEGRKDKAVKVHT